MEIKMKPVAVVIAQLTTVFLAAATFAQGTSWQPSKIPPLSFDRAAAAKIYKDKSGTKVLGLISFKQVPENYTVEVPVTVLETRSVTDPKTGETREETYEKTKTMTATKTRTKIVSRRVEVPLTDIKIWTVGGKSLSSDEAQTALATTRRCFFIRPSWKRAYEYSGEPFFAEMLKDDVLVIWHDEDKAKEITEASETSKQPGKTASPPTNSSEKRPPS
jgi:hypothetical protein